MNEISHTLIKLGETKIFFTSFEITNEFSLASFELRHAVHEH